MPAIADSVTFPEVLTSPHWIVPFVLTPIAAPFGAVACTTDESPFSVPLGSPTCCTALPAQSLTNAPALEYRVVAVCPAALVMLVGSPYWPLAGS